jgi:hypothetical protein
MQNWSAFRRRELLVGHRRVRATEVERLILDAFDPAARTDGLIVDLDLGDFRVLFEPLLVERRGEAAACTGQRLGFI